MEQLPENQADQAVAVEEKPAVSIGRTLREAREKLGLSVADVAAQIKFAPRQIEALEADDFGHLPEAAFVRGFVRSYAKILQLDAQLLLATLTQAKAAEPSKLAPDPLEVLFPDSYWTRRRNQVWLGFASLLAVVVVVFAARSCTTTDDRTGVNQVDVPVALPAEVHVSPGETSDTAAVPEPAGVTATTPEVAVQTPASVPKPAPSPTPVQAKPLKPVVSEAKSVVTGKPGAGQVSILHMEFDQESWVEIQDRDGNILRSQNYQPGGDLRLDGNAPFTLLIGNAPSVRLHYKGKPVDLAPHTRSSTQVAHLTLE